MEKSRYKSILSTTKDDNYDLRAAVVVHCNLLNCSLSCKTFKAMESSAIKSFWNLCQNRLLNARECLGNFSFCQKFLTRNSLFLLETHFSYSKLAFLTRNSLFLLETHFSYSKLTFLTRNSLFQGTLYLAAFISRWISKTLLHLLQANFQDPS